MQWIERKTKELMAEGEALWSRAHSSFIPVFLGFSAWVLVGCAAPDMDISTELGRQAILAETHRLLTDNHCSDAINTIEPLYQSVYVTNDVRMARSAAFACGAGITDFLGLITTLPTKSFASVPNQGSYMFRTAAELFYSSSSTTLLARSSYGVEAVKALLSVINPSTYIFTSNLLYSGTNNPGSASATDRTDDSNIYMITTALAEMGALEARYGVPSTSSWKKSQNLGANGVNDWSLATRVNGDGCAMAASVLNLVDSSVAVLPKLSTSLSSSLSALSSLTPLMDAACDAGCLGTTGSGCAIAGGCSTCPTVLRDPGSCTGSSSNVASCAAAGLLYFINTNTTYGWVGP